MTEPGSQVRVQWGAVLAFSAVLAALTAAAGLTMASALMYYDDEGYVLISLRNFIEHGRLYRDVFTQYGPFPFVFHYGLHALGLPLTHTTGRLLTLALWGGAALASAAIAGQATRSLAVRLAVLAAVFVHLWVMVNEPTHPGGLIAFITALLAWLGYRWIDRGQMRAAAWLIGAGTAALLLTKINIGGFAGLSALAWLFLHHENPTVRRWSPALLTLGAVLLPFALMRPLLATPWALTFALMFAGAGAMAIGASALAATPRVSWRTFGQGALAALALALVVLVVVFLRGTRPHDLLEGVLLRPFRHPVHFNLRFLWPAATPAMAAVAGLLFAAAVFLRCKGIATVDPAIAIVRLLATLALAGAIAQFPSRSPDALVLAFAMPWVWVFLWPLAGENASALAARRWVGLLFLGQCLHAFPVPGSQIAWGTFLAIPLAACGAWSAATWLAARFSLAPGAATRRALLAALMLFAFVTTGRLAQVAARYRIGWDLGLPGAEHIRPPERTAAVYRAFTLNATVHADVLFSLPGMFSFNLWSGVPTPTLANVTHWFSLLDEAEQTGIARALESQPRSAVIVQRDHLAFLAQRGFSPSGTLFDFFTRRYEKAFAIGGFEFWMQRGRTLAPLSTAQLYHRETATGGDFQLDLTVLTPPGARLARLDWIETVTDRPAQSRLTLDARNSRLEVTPLLTSGAALAAPAPAQLPAALPRIVRLSFVTDQPLSALPRRNAVLQLRDAEGQLVAEALFAD